MSEHEHIPHYESPVDEEWRRMHETLHLQPPPRIIADLTLHSDGRCTVTLTHYGKMCRGWHTAENFRKLLQDETEQILTTQDAP